METLELWKLVQLYSGPEIIERNCVISSKMVMNISNAIKHEKWQEVTLKTTTLLSLNHSLLCLRMQFCDL